jgi:hypothetical protein
VDSSVRFYPLRGVSPGERSAGAQRAGRAVAREARRAFPSNRRGGSTLRAGNTNIAEHRSVLRRPSCSLRAGRFGGR